MRVLVLLTMLSPTAAAEVAPDLFTRDQGRLDGLVRWGSDVVALSTPPRRLDLVAGTSEPVTVPGLDAVLAVGGEAPRHALGRQGTTLRLLREKGSTWESVELPPKLKAARGEVSAVIGASGAQVAVSWVEVGPKPAPTVTATFAASSAGAWVEHALERQASGSPTRLVFAQGRWLLAYARGEWGGGLWAASAKGVHRVGAAGGLPVVGVVPLADGRVLVGEGLAHLRGARGAVGIVAADGRWEVLAQSDRFEPARRKSWQIEPDSVEGVDLDAQGRPIVFTGSQGIFRLDAGALESVTPGWPAGRHVYGRGLVVVGDRAVIATFDSGVLMWKLGTSEVRRIAIPGR